MFADYRRKIGKNVFLQNFWGEYDRLIPPFIGVMSHSDLIGITYMFHVHGKRWRFGTEIVCLDQEISIYS